jgi:mono/diheme cytochrome c family protein
MIGESADRMRSINGPVRRRRRRCPSPARERPVAARFTVALAALVTIGSGVWTLGAAAEAPAKGDAERGARVYARACAACHGPAGQGNGPGAGDLDPAPRDFTQGQFRFRTTATGQLPSSPDIERTIRKGLPGTAMPAFGELFSAKEIADLTAHVMAFAPASQTEGIAPVEVAVPVVAPATPDSIHEGQNLYRIMECWACHGLDGSGRGTSAEGMVNEVGQTITPTDFRYAPLKGGHEPADVVRTLLTGLNGTPMPSYGEAMLFAREDVEDLSTDAGRLPRAAIDDMTTFIKTCPGRDDITAMDDEKKRALRDRRLAALAHYILSLRQHGLWSWLFRESPEKEPRP